MFSKQLRLLAFRVAAISASVCGFSGTLACKRDAATPGTADVSAAAEPTDATVESQIGTQPDDAAPATDAPATIADAAADAVDAAALVTATDPLCLKDELPDPGQPCDNVGEVQCTNAGAKISKTLLKYCFRPHSVVCEWDTGGMARWRVTACASIVPASNNCREPSCMIWGAEHVCQPTVLDPQGAKISLGAQNYKDIQASTTWICPNDIGWKHCGGPVVETCAKLADLKDLAAPTEAAYGECGKYLHKGAYLLYSEICHSELNCPPKSQQNPDGNGGNSYFITKCMLDPATTQPVCQKTCKDVGAPGY